jgi:hypothetical protein
MAADLNAIRAALASVISAGIPNLRAYGQFQSQINPPCAVILPQPNQAVRFDTFEGGLTFMLRIVLLVSYTEDASSQTALDAYLGNLSTSVYRLIRSNPTLGGVCESADPTAVRGYGAGASGYGLMEWAGQQYLGTNLLVNVMAT